MLSAGPTCCTGAQWPTKTRTGAAERRHESVRLPSEEVEQRVKAELVSSSAHQNLPARSAHGPQSDTGLRLSGSAPVPDPCRCHGSTIHNRSEVKRRLTFDSPHRWQHPEKAQNIPERPGRLTGKTQHDHGEAVRFWIHSELELLIFISIISVLLIILVIIIISSSSNRAMKAAQTSLGQTCRRGPETRHSSLSTRLMDERKSQDAAAARRAAGS